MSMIFKPRFSKVLRTATVSPSLETWPGLVKNNIVDNIVNNIVDNYEEYGQHNIVASCFQQP